MRVHARARGKILIKITIGKRIFPFLIANFAANHYICISKRSMNT